MAVAVVALGACAGPRAGPAVAALPATAGPAPVVLPAGPGGGPVTVRFVRSRRLVNLGADARAAVEHRCVPGGNGHPVPGEVGGRLLVAVEGPLVLVGSGHGLAACLVELLDRDGPPDYSWSDKPMLRWWWSERGPDLSRPPAEPIEVFDRSNEVLGTVDWERPTWFWQAFGRVSTQVRELFAVIPGGEASRVPVGATGAFALYWHKTVATVEQASHRPALSLFARDSAGRVLTSVTLP